MVGQQAGGARQGSRQVVRGEAADRVARGSEEGSAWQAVAHGATDSGRWGGGQRWAWRWAVAGGVAGSGEQGGGRRVGGRAGFCI